MQQLYGLWKYRNELCFNRSSWAGVQVILRGIAVVFSQWAILCSGHAKRARAGDHSFTLGACHEPNSTAVAGSRLMGRRLRPSSLSGLPASEDAAGWEASIVGQAKHAEESSRGSIEDGI